MAVAYQCTSFMKQSSVETERLHMQLQTPLFPFYLDLGNVVVQRLGDNFSMMTDLDKRKQCYLTTCHLQK